jgi:putative FmdB family regulatory protein
MPNYDYLCADCGPFTAFKPIARYQEPEPCPACAASAPRTILTAPAVAGISSGGGESKPAWLSGMKRHPSSCACC